MFVGQIARDRKPRSTHRLCGFSGRRVNRESALRGHLQAQGVSLEQYLEMGNTTMEQLRDHAREQAAAAARYELAMTEIARREGIDITEADVDAKYAELSKQYGLSVELLRQQLPPLRLRHDMLLSNWQLDPPLAADAFDAGKALGAQKIAFSAPVAPAGLVRLIGSQYPWLPAPPMPRRFCR